jgi:hypothetical protein
MNDVGQSFTFAFKDQRWLSKFALIGLAGLIPIVGNMWLLGWMLATRDNLRAGRGDLAEVQGSQIGRGAPVVLVILVYYLVLIALIMVPLMLIFFAAVSSSVASRGSSESSAVFGPLFTLYASGVTLLSLVGYFMYLPLVVAVERHGVGGGLNPGVVWGIARHNLTHTLIAGLLVYAAMYAGSLGLFLCCIGLIITYPYGYAVMAGVLFRFEQTLPPPPAPVTAG